MAGGVAHDDAVVGVRLEVEPSGTARRCERNSGRQVVDQEVEVHVDRGIAGWPRGRPEVGDRLELDASSRPGDDRPDLVETRDGSAGELGVEASELMRIGAVERGRAQADGRSGCVANGGT